MTYMPNGIPLLGIAVTHLHPGAGRTPGIVDLPVVRDNLGYPLVFAQSVKGALKTRCMKEQKGNGSECKCFFGGEVGEGEKGAGAITILDLVPIAFPVASADRGFVYVASPVLLSRATAMLSILDSPYASLFRKLAEEARNAALAGLGFKEGDTVYITTLELSVDKSISLDQATQELFNALVDTAATMHPMASALRDRLVVVGDDKAPSIIDKALLRVTRVRLTRDTKTVAQGALWTEEYIPQGTVFLTAVVASNYINEFCSNLCKDASECLEKAKKFLNLNGELPVFIGGKETVGKGLIVFRVLARHGEHGSK